MSLAAPENPELCLPSPFLSFPLNDGSETFKTHGERLCPLALLLLLSLFMVLFLPFFFYSLFDSVLFLFLMQLNPATADL